MCGINGFNFKNEQLVKAMNLAIRHRGPDDQGIFLDNKMSLGHVRLSIIDLSKAGHCPMFYSKQLGACSEKHLKQNISKSKACIVFNGEIYNYLELRKELEAKGYKFTTSSDTEVILASYLEKGTDCVKDFNGMWAFCIYDLEKQELLLSRDRVGKKPLYYYLHNKTFIFSSELKGILANKELRINTKHNIMPEAVEFYFTLGYIPSPFSIYKNVHKLEPRQSLVFDLKKNSIKKKWYYYEIPEYAPIYNKKKLIVQGRSLMLDSTRLRMRSDVPIGAFLSGGLDSSTVVGLMKEFTQLEKLHTFSIGFKGKYDETKYMSIVKDAFKTKHHHEYFDEEDFEKTTSIYPWIYDEPFGDYSGFPTYALSKLAKKYVTVSLSGDGGDEIFAGYNIHLLAWRLEFLRKLPKLVRLIGSKMPAKKNFEGFASLYLLKEAFRMSFEKPEKFFANALQENSLKSQVYNQWTEEKLKECLVKANGHFGEAMRLFDLVYNTLGDNFLMKVDRASMANALEVRSPFLDYRFIEYSQTIPSKWKTDLRITKKLMREIIKGIVPEPILKRKKQGFTPPLEKWITSQKYDKELEKALSIVKDLNPEIARFYEDKVLKENNRLYNNYRIRLYLFLLWWKKWI
jgi:asparagine synthase (glutamine-hydrolysing)